MSDIKHIVDIPRSICNKKQARQAVQSQPICIVDGYHEYIIDEIECSDHIEYETEIHNDDK